MTQLRYKDYQEAVTFADGTLIVQILHIDDLITTECESASQAQAAKAPESTAEFNQILGIK